MDIKMEIYERIRELRKNHLKMSMEAFGKRLGVSRDTINNIELNRLARPDQKMSLYKLICSEFNVNEDWLLTEQNQCSLKPQALFWISSGKNMTWMISLPI